MSDTTKQEKKPYAKPELAVIDLLGDSVLASCWNSGNGSEPYQNSCRMATGCKFNSR